MNMHIYFDYFSKFLQAIFLNKFFTSNFHIFTEAILYIFSCREQSNFVEQSLTPNLPRYIIMSITNNTHRNTKEINYGISIFGKKKLESNLTN